ncbi:unnamed protein product [Mytilus edulis]|uniref:Uncharacterized protein n=1 Tax=Mytilus edulis TaxID=6550 RepID=A0A8S3U0Y4_MYTED|nr:unnamed protein product [Mytilus edulis]
MSFISFLNRKRRVEYTVRGNTTKVPEEAAAQMDLDDEEAEPATYAIQTNLNQERSTVMMIRNIDDVSSDEEEDSDDDDDNEMAEDEVFLHLHSLSLTCLYPSLWMRWFWRRMPLSLDMESAQEVVGHGASGSNTLEPDDVYNSDSDTCTRTSDQNKIGDC